MKGFVRENQLLSLCGLNCGLCPMKLDGYCPGCGGGDGNQSCAIARCSIKRGWSIVFSVSLILCENYQTFDVYDSFYYPSASSSGFYESPENGDACLLYRTAGEDCVVETAAGALQ